MKNDELYQLLCKGQVTLAFDTNAVFGDKEFGKICDNVNRLNEKDQYEFNIVVSSLVHTEKLFDLKQSLKDKYNQRIVTQFLSSKGIRVEAFEEEHAEVTANLIAQQFPTTEEWYKFKRQDCINCLGLQNAETEMPGKGKKCGATVVWLIAGHAYTKDYLLITQDLGKEFKDIQKKTDLKNLKIVLEQLIQKTFF